MTYISSFFDAVETSPDVFDRVYPASYFARRFEVYFKDGIVLAGAGTLTTQLEVTADTGLNTVVDLGVANIKGYTVEVTEAETMTHPTADPTNPRIDRIVLQLSNDPAVRFVNIIVKEGTPSATPTAPALTRTLVGGIYNWELSLAQVNIPAGASTVGTITDERNNPSVCGISDLTLGTIDANSVVVDNSSFVNLSGTDAQTVFEEIDGALGASIYTSLSQIGLTDGDFTGLSQVAGMKLLWDNIPNNSIFQVNCIGDLQTSVAPFSDTFKVQGVLKITKQTSTIFMACEYFRRSTRDLTDPLLPSQRTSQSFYGSFDDTLTGNDRFSGWRIAGGAYLINAIVSPNNTVNYSAIETANAVIVRLRSSPDNENNRCMITIPRDKSDQLVSNIWGTGGYFGAVKVNFFNGDLTYSVTSDSDTRLDSITCI